MLTIEERVKLLTSIADRAEAVRIIGLFLAELEKGAIRAAERDEDGVWQARAWVKEGILSAFRFGVLAEFASGALSFIDKGHHPAAPLQDPGRRAHRSRWIVDSPRCACRERRGDDAARVHQRRRVRR
jgi:hypothetical protein